MNTRCVLGAVAALVLASHAFAQETQTIEVGSFVNTGIGAMNYTGAFNDHISHALVDGHTVITVDVASIVGSLGFDKIWSISVTDNAFNSYGSLSPGADIDLFRIDGTYEDFLFSYAGPNPTHQPESADRLGERLLQLDSYSGAQDQWDVTQVSLGWSGTVTASFLQPIDLLPHFTSNPGSGGSGGTGTGPVFNPNPGSGDSEAGDLPILSISEHGTFESFRVAIVASQTVPAPGALALLGVAGLVARRRRR